MLEELIVTTEVVVAIFVVVNVDVADVDVIAFEEVVDVEVIAVAVEEEHDDITRDTTIMQVTITQANPFFICPPFIPLTKCFAEFNVTALNCLWNYFIL